ncbi:MAG TPA: TlpA disulfide reductase family protein [Pyrinomonadaceae bacterium]|nr:TlpA disulfide reductase family protein [Pyrinomonadaceae bacterium]
MKLRFGTFRLALAAAIVGTALLTLNAKGQRAQVPDIRMATIDGKMWTLSDLRGKVVVLNFWATWCVPCRTEVPNLVALGREHKQKGLEVAGISLDEDLGLVKKFITEYKVDYPVLIPDPDSPWRSLDNTPTTLLIDRQGKLIQKYIGAVPEETLRADTRSALVER